MECCGKCEYHKLEQIGNSAEWVCANKESDNYGMETEYRESCEEFKERG